MDRKLAFCAIHTGDVQPVCNMWETVKNESVLDGETIYVMYRLSLATLTPGLGLGLGM